MKAKTLQNIKSSRLLHGAAIVAVVFAFTASQMVPAFVEADRFQQQINELEEQNDKKENSQSILGQEAASLSDAINRLQGEINASQARIDQLNGEIEQLKADIAAAEAELEKQKTLLAATIKALYVSGEISTIEMLATSKDLSDFFDKQQYQASVRDKVKIALDKVTQLKFELNAKREAVERSLKEQQALQNQLAAQQAEKNRVLALNQEQQNALEEEIKNNSAKIADLRKQQAEENARLFARSGGGVQNVPDTTGYPWANYRDGAWTHAGSCFYGDDIDPWGMCYRQCVSYVAWKVWKSGYYMPNWGGVGNANNWDENARAAGFAVDNNPGNGNDGTVAVSNYGTWGHVMYVEWVNGSTVGVSQYNVGLDGRYSLGTINASDVVFIHFPPR